MLYKQMKDIVEDVCFTHHLFEDRIDVDIDDSVFNDNTRLIIRQDYLNRVITVEVVLKKKGEKKDD